MSWITDRIVVVPLDMSEFSLKALDTARQMVEDKTFIRVLHVLPRPERAIYAINDEARGLQTRAALSAYLQENGYEKMNITVRIGDPSNEITSFAEQIGAGLIVIPSHGRGIFTKMLLGSTTDRVTQLAQCPVLILKDNKLQKNS